MADESTFRGVIEFFDRLGIYDVVLPFLLVYTLVFAILDKSKILGTEKVGEEGIVYPKKNLNAIVAFVVAFMVVSSSKLVEAITEISSNMVVLLMLGIFFMLLLGTFWKEGDPIHLDGGWKTLFMIIMFVGIALIFLDGIETDDGDSWLDYSWDWLDDHWDTNAIASIILVLFIVGFMWFVQSDSTPKKKNGNGDS